jgi:fused signal recognition particle receptor
MTAGRVGEQKLSVWQRIRRFAMTDVGALVRGLKQDDLEQIERVLIEADFGVPTTLELTSELERLIRDGKIKTDAELRARLVSRLAGILAGPDDPGAIARAEPGPTVVLVMGVNGVGKTTTVAKLAKRLTTDGRRVLVAAADTYRAGAIAQLEIWAERLGVPCVSGAPGGDPAAVLFDAVDAATARGADTVLVDTAGRLHTQEGLMEELRKVARVAGRRVEGAPHEALLVLDGTVGQNAIQQGRLFAQAVPLTGIIVTKLDGSARGGAVAALRRELGLPVRFIGTGEGADDLQPFDPQRFAESLLEDGTP